METNYHTFFSNKLIKTVFGLLFLISSNAFSQVEEDDKPKDSVGYKTGRVEIGNPNSIINAYTYDPITNRYIYTSTFEGFNINYPIILTPKEYEELVLRESMRAYYKQKSKAIDGKGTDAEKKDLLPRYSYRLNMSVCCVSP